MSLITGVWGNRPPSIVGGGASMPASWMAAPAAIALGLALGTGEDVTGAGGGCFAQPVATPSTSVVVTTDDKLRRASDRGDARGAVSTTSEGLCEIFPMTPGKEVSN